MFNFKLHYGDIQFDETRNIVLVSDDDDIVQSIAEILNVNAGEWFLNDEHGMKRYEILGKKRFTDDEIKNVVSAAIFQESRVDQISSLSIDFDRKTRHLTVEFEIIKKDETIVRGEVGVDVNGTGL